MDNTQCFATHCYRMLSPHLAHSNRQTCVQEKSLSYLYLYNKYRFLETISKSIIQNINKIGVKKLSKPIRIQARKQTGI